MEDPLGRTKSERGKEVYQRRGEEGRTLRSRQYFWKFEPLPLTVIRETALSISFRFPRILSCTLRAKALTVRPVMRIFLRRAGLALGAGMLILCCSCERHRAEDLELLPP